MIFFKIFLQLTFIVTLVFCTNDTDTFERQNRMIHGRLHRPRYTVYLRIYRGESSSSTCSASILTPRVILTAAHCISPRRGDYDVPKNPYQSKLRRIQIFVGLNGLTYTTRSEYNKDHPNRTPSIIIIDGDELNQVYTNSHWYRSLDYKIRHKLPLGDIALIKLPADKQIDMALTDSASAKIFAPEINNVENVNNFKTHAAFSTAVGYGTIETLSESYRNHHNSAEKDIRKAHFRIGNNVYCRNWAKSQGINHKLMDVKNVFCAVGITDKDYKVQVCKGDSGGPLFIKTYYKGSKDYYEFSQIGITVWVDSECDSNFNGFLRISDYLPWIEQSLGKEEYSKIKIAPTKEQALESEKEYGIKNSAVRVGSPYDFDQVVAANVVDAEE